MNVSDGAASVTKGLRQLNTPASVTGWAAAEARRRNLANAQMVKTIAEKDTALAGMMRMSMTIIGAREVIAWAAAEHGEWCGICAGDMPERVYRYFVPFAEATIPHCIDCAFCRSLYPPIGRCSCDRLVYTYSRRTNAYAFCCTDHRADQVNAARRRRRRSCRGTICGECGAAFDPPRSDGRYCSAACRQKAYRKRRAAA